MAHHPYNLAILHDECHKWATGRRQEAIIAQALYCQIGEGCPDIGREKVIEWIESLHLKVPVTIPPLDSSCV